MKVSPRGKNKAEKKARQRGFKEDSPLSDFQTSKAFSVFSSSDTFVPPLYACRHVLATLKRLLQHTDSSVSTRITCLPLRLPHAVTSAQSKLLLHGVKLGGTNRGVSSPRELQQVCIRHAPTQPVCSFTHNAGMVQVSASAAPSG